ncbi:MAG: ribosome biogenesis GTP-binding protein YihA/YsxC [Chlamydiota bacterium]
MKKILFSKARFLKSAKNLKGYPSLGHHVPEIAIAGRSNVGKSSLLSTLFRNKSLVKVSGSPGKTQLLNFFAIDQDLMVVDLPGYGYAQVPTKVKKEWGPMVENYLQNRPNLKLVLFLIDIRREPNADDFQFLEWAIQAQKAVILVITKVDKVSRNVRATNTKKILEKFNCQNLHSVHYSSKNKEGLDKLIKMVHDALQDEMEE